MLRTSNVTFGNRCNMRKGMGEEGSLAGEGEGKARVKTLELAPTL